MLRKYNWYLGIWLTPEMRDCLKLIKPPDMNFSEFVRDILAQYITSIDIRGENKWENTGLEL